MPQSEVHRYAIPFNGNATLYVSVKDEVAYDQCLFDVQRRKTSESHYLPRLLSIKPEDSANYVGRIAGEYIEDGELLAEKLTAGGLIERKVVSGDSGIISLDRISQGYIDILGESMKVSYNSIIKGKVMGVSLGSHIEIEAPSVKLPFITGKNLESAEEQETSTIVGELVLIKDGRSVFGPEDLKRSYEGSIVYAGRFLYPSLAREIFLRGASAVVAYSMNYGDLQDLKVPVAVIGGFGQLKINMDTEDLICKSANHLIELNHEDLNVYIANQDGLDTERFPGKKYFSNKIEPGEAVISVGPDHRGIVGEVIEVVEQDGPNKVIVSTKGNNRMVMYDEMLEHYYFKK